MKKLKSNKAIKATIWSALGVYTNKFLALGITAILSRLLTPEDFGTLAMVTVISGFLGIFADAGIASAVIQFRDLQSKDHQTLFSLSLLFGLILAGLFALGSAFFASFFNKPELKLVIIVMSLAFPCSTLGIVPHGILQREMRFREIALINIVAASVAGIIGIVMAITGWGYWSLVAQALCNSFLASCTFLAKARLAPIPRWDGKVIRKIFSYSGNLTLFSTVNYFARNLDNLLIGKYFGSVPLAFYNHAYQLMMLPLSMLSSVITPVIHSELAEKQNDLSAMYKGYQKIVRLIALISIPGMTFAVIMAPELIRVVWGDQWEKSIPIFVILGLNGIFQPILSTTGTVFLARNKADWLFKCGIISTIILCSGIISGIPFGIKGVAIGYTVASILWATPLMYLIFVKILHGKFIDFLVAIRFPSLFSIIGAPVLYWQAAILRHQHSDIPVLLVLLIGSVAVYMTFLFFFESNR